MNFILRNLPEIAGAIIIPSALFISNYMLRRAFGIAMMSPSDVLILSMGFDAAVLLNKPIFQEMIIDPELRKNIVAFHLIMLFIALIFWISSITYVDSKARVTIPREIAWKDRVFLRDLELEIPRIKLIVSWTLTCFIVIAQVGAFIFKFK